MGERSREMTNEDKKLIADYMLASRKFGESCRKELYVKNNPTESQKPTLMNLSVI